MSAYKNGWKEATREAAKAAGHYDGRFAPKAYKDRYHDLNKSLCRKPVEFEEDLEVEVEVEDRNHSLEWNETVSFNPFQNALEGL